ncbi:MAG TPA: EF-hand domain-containing protein [Allosphingosinicella sp.]
MIRLVAGGASALLLIAAGFFILKSRAEADDPIPPAPAPSAAYSRPFTGPGFAAPPAATERSKAQKRFARADRDRDGRITLGEQLQPRRKAFARADRDGNGSLSFEEWAAGTAERFAKADKDRSGWLSPAEYEASKPKAKPKPKCRC